jgi:hypothetical protein
MKKVIEFGWGKPSHVWSKHKDGAFLPSGFDKKEDSFLKKALDSHDWDHDFSAPLVKPEQLPIITSKIQEATGGKVKYYWYLKGYGCVGIHDDRGSDIDEEGCIAFMVPLRIKHFQKTWPSNNVEYGSGDEFRFLSSDENGRYWPTARLGHICTFDPRFEHGIMTSSGWYILCGLLELK